MAQTAMFNWHKAALLFAEGVQIARPKTPPQEGFRAISGHSSAQTLDALGTALRAGDSFCVSEDPLPKTLTAEPATFLTLTGGSSGQPKIIRRTQASWIASFEVNAAQFNLSPQDKLAVLGKLSHSLALYGVLEALHIGIDAYVLDGMRPVEQVDQLQQKAVSVLYATPTQLRLLCRRAQDNALPDVRLILCGGGALDQTTLHKLNEVCPNTALHQFYGAAETSFVTMSGAQTQTTSSGRPYPCVTLRILGDAGNPTSDVGEVWVKSPYLFQGYADGNSPDTRWRDGYLSVGEFGQLDASGALHLAGRKSRRVTIADQTVYPETIETYLTAQPEVHACAILPVRDALRGQRLVAVLEGAENQPLKNEIRQSCRAKFGALATPSHVLFLDAFPQLSSGKVDLVALATWVDTQI